MLSVYKFLPIVGAGITVAHVSINARKGLVDPLSNN